MNLETLRKGLKTGLWTTWVLGKVIFPVTLIVTVLSFTPVIEWVTIICKPLMGWIGLPGEAAIPLVLANFLNLYAGIGAILTMDLTVKEVLILALMMSFSHNLLIETAVSTKVGVKASVVVAIRLGLALFSALFIHYLWQGGDSPAQYGLIPSTNKEEVEGLLSILLYGMKTAGMGILQLAMIVIPLMVFIQWMKDIKVIDLFTKWMRPITKSLGLAPNTATTLLAGLLFGLAYGAGVIIQAVKEDHVAKKDIYLVFVFLAACHAVIEDTLIFIPLGIPVWILLVFRLVTAIILTIIVAYMWRRVEQRKSLAQKKGAHNEI